MTDFSTQRRNKGEGVSLHFGAKLMRPEQTPVKRTWQNWGIKV